ncbi:MAG: BspA family leucine-rich repeat surface protein, partial [Candidatus Paceibacterota bacterium]
NYSEPGIYTVTITGNISLRFDSHANAHKLKTVEQWGNNEWKSMYASFKGCSNLTIVATDIPNLSQVTNMEEAFSNATAFNQSINNWDVSNVTNMKRLFYKTTNFNQPLNDWNVSNVTNMSEMFAYTPNFNQPLNDWNVTNVTNMERMFYTHLSNVTLFNKPIGNWNISNVVNLNGMLYNAYNFNQDLSSWDFSNSNSLDFIKNTGFDYTNYDALLQRFFNFVIDGYFIIDATGLEFCDEDFRNFLQYNSVLSINGDSKAAECSGNIARGSISYDEFGNCNQGLPLIERILVNANNGISINSTISNNQLYSLNLLEGIHTLTLPNIPNYFSINPESHDVIFTGYGGETFRNFCLTANQSIKDLNIAIIPVSNSSTGMESTYRMVVQNIGTNSVNNVTISLNYDNSKQAFVTASFLDSTMSPTETNSGF